MVWPEASVMNVNIVVVPIKKENSFDKWVIEGGRLLGDQKKFTFFGKLTAKVWYVSAFKSTQLT